MPGCPTDNIWLGWQIMNSTVSDPIAVAFHQRRSELETNLVGSILCDPQKGMPIAQAAAATVDLFQQEDLQLIYRACDTMRESPLIDVLIGAKESLQAEGYWNAHGAISWGPHWSDETLVSYANSWFHCPPAIQGYARRLLDMIAREREITELQQRIVDLITGDRDPEFTSLPTVTISRARRIA